jgi:hypothetical protein
MAPRPAAEILPELYRSVLDAVASLEQRGQRPAAARIRAEAIAVYSRRWDADAARRLAELRIMCVRLSHPRTGVMARHARRMARSVLRLQRLAA